MINKETGEFQSEGNIYDGEAKFDFESLTGVIGHFSLRNTKILAISSSVRGISCTKLFLWCKSYRSSPPIQI